MTSNNYTPNSRYNFIFIASVGRSGSTFFGHRLAHHGDYFYFGEKRFLWSMMKKIPALGRYFLKRNLRENTEGKIVLDKTPCIHHYLTAASGAVTIRGIILLERDIKAINLSAQRIESQGINLRWLRLRMQKYWREYGIFGVFAPLARFHHVFHAFGISTGAFGRSLFSKNLQDEFADLVVATNSFSKKHKVPIIKIAYENFKKDCEQLTGFGVSPEQINKLIAEFSPKA